MCEVENLSLVVTFSTVGVSAVLVWSPHLSFIVCSRSIKGDGDEPASSSSGR